MSIDGANGERVIAVIGASGRQGGAVVHALETDGQFKVRALSRHLQVASDIGRANIDILPLTVKDLHASKTPRREYGLLTNDSLIVAVMRNHKLRHLATYDSGFLRVSGMQVWMPEAEEGGQT